ncbi:protein shisa-8 isoform X1 [Chelonoidis abingdonii]|uniref:protein shisa-8 isoform X1 n=1 Tax=Chelonoidis abingdonii TaxID=106734 RepID=UPI0013F1D852|nr:protein shisa-8 isoform X1 [Chelonoidis abingdonii]
MASGSGAWMERGYIFGVCCLVLLDPGRVWTRAPSTQDPELEGQMESHGNTSWALTLEDTVVAPTEAVPGGDRCRGYYDVMGQWDPPFNCNSGIYRYCCGTCGYRFCCQFKHGRLDQSGCSNYDTPNWVNTGQPPARVDETPEDPTRDKTNMIVYIICGVVAMMVLVGIFTKLGLEKSRSPPTEMTMSRTLTDLLKQPGHSPLDHMTDDHVGSIEVQMGDGLARSSPRNGTESFFAFPDNMHLNNAVVSTPLAPQMGLPHAHSNWLQMTSTMPHQAPDYTKYATLKAVESAPEEFYKRFPMVDMPPPGPLSFPPIGLHQNDVPPLHDSCALVGLATPGQKAKVVKTNAHPRVASPAFKGGWDPSHHHPPDVHRQIYANKRQFSVEKLPEVFSQTPTHYVQPSRPFSTNSKTEVTV